MLIYLLRHGVAEDGFGIDDAERALTEDGWRKLRDAAPAWRRLVEDLDVVVQSPLRRARETAAVLLEAVGGDPKLRTEAMLEPGADPQLAMEFLLAELRSSTDGIALVGHEPHLGALLGLLLTGREHSAVPLKKGMLVAVELARPTSLIGALKFSLSWKAAARLR
ncbi:MAG: histidine phosphatase family protein [Planctomycetes bacterium]|nr:histidine phosphatase family protein [Planctomycetota bacterium]